MPPSGKQRRGRSLERFARSDAASLARCVELGELEQPDSLGTGFDDEVCVPASGIGGVRAAEQQDARELKESLEQQTAASEVLELISSSPGELGPVFEAVLTNAVRICEAKFANLFLYDGQMFRHVAKVVISSCSLLVAETGLPPRLVIC